MRFPRRILVGLAAGIVTGIVLGDRVSPLRFIADGFVRLLQVMVLPYVTLSIITSLGALTGALAFFAGVTDQLKKVFPDIVSNVIGIQSLK